MGPAGGTGIIIGHKIEALPDARLQYFLQRSRFRFAFRKILITVSDGNLIPGADALSIGSREIQPPII